MGPSIPEGRVRRWGPAGLAVFLLVAGSGLHEGGCTCGVDPDEISVTPDCPGGVSPAASLTLNGDLDLIRPADGDKLLRVLGTRRSTEVCVPTDAIHSFTVQLTGDGAVNQPQVGLAPGQWEISIVALSGGDHPEVTQNVTLAGGGAHQLTVGGELDGDIQAVFGGL